MWSILAKIAGALFSYAASQNPNGSAINKATSGFKQLSNKIFEVIEENISKENYLNIINSCKFFRDLGGNERLNNTDKKDYNMIEKECKKILKW